MTVQFDLLVTTHDPYCQIVPFILVLADTTIILRRRKIVLVSSMFII